MQLTRAEVQEIIEEMRAALASMEALMDTDRTPSYTMLWRRMMRLEETLNRHPY